MTELPCLPQQMTEIENATLRARIAELEAEVERLKNREQTDVDNIVYYRNLAIMLGAKPTDMRSRDDRHLCEEGIQPNTDEYDPFKERQEVVDIWAENEALDGRLTRALEVIRQVDCALHAILADPDNSRRTCRTDGAADGA